MKSYNLYLLCCLNICIFMRMYRHWNRNSFPVTAAGRSRLELSPRLKVGWSNPSRDIGDDHNKRMPRVTVGVPPHFSRLWVPCLGQNLQHFTGNADVSIWVRNSLVGRKTPNIQTTIQTNNRTNERTNKDISRVSNARSHNFFTDNHVFINILHVFIRILSVCSVVVSFIRK